MSVWKVSQVINPFVRYNWIFSSAKPQQFYSFTCKDLSEQKWRIIWLSVGISESEKNTADIIELCASQSFADYWSACLCTKTIYLSCKCCSIRQLNIFKSCVTHRILHSKQQRSNFHNVIICNVDVSLCWLLFTSQISLWTLPLIWKL